MASKGSISRWIEGLKEGSPTSAQQLWERYFPQLVELARQRLQGAPRRMADEEDVALSAIDRFCRAAQQGRFPDLADRDDLWRLLLRITSRRALDLARHERRRRRGGGRVQGEVGVETADSAAQPRVLAIPSDDGPSPEFAAMMTDQCRHLLEQLGDPQLRAIALAKMEGYGNREIAEQLGCSLRTVERRLKLIRDEWRQELRHERT